MTSIRHLARHAILTFALIFVIIAHGLLASSAMAAIDSARTSGEQIIICTPEGIKTIVRPSPDGSSQTADCECPSCALCSPLAVAFAERDGCSTGFMFLPTNTLAVHPFKHIHFADQ